MATSLNGQELVEFIKVRQLKQVRGLRQAEKIIPRLAIVCCGTPNPVIQTYVRLKKAYGEDILVEVDEYLETITTVQARIRQLASDDTVHGIIVQLPIDPVAETDVVLAHIPAQKDVDGLVEGPQFTAATPTAISWLLAGYGVSLDAANIAIVGNGKLVGAPLAALWRASGYTVDVFEKDDGHDLMAELPQYEVVVTATGVPGVITSEMLRHGAVVVDAGTASEDGVIKGDLAAAARQRSDIRCTPEKGGVGPLTVAALFDNVILAARRCAEARKKTTHVKDTASE